MAERRTLNSGGILPLALGIPAFLGLMAVGVRLTGGADELLEELEAPLEVGGHGQ